MSTEIWQEYYERLARLVREHRTTLVFVNTRRLAERLARHLSERLGDDAVAAHHGSLSKERRLDAETRLKNGALKVLVATASLELGIDIGHVDLVCQIGSPHRIATLLQRVGRSGHTVAGTPKGRVFPASRDDLVECIALLRAVRSGDLDRIVVQDAPNDVLAQQIVAETSCREYTEDELFAVVRRAWPYRDLERSRFDAVVTMLAEGFATKRGRRGALIYRDEVQQRLRGRRGSRLLALTSGGAIPEVADYRMVLEPDDTFIGTLNEDFAIESMAGDVIQLGNMSWRVLQVGAGVIRVADAKGAPPNIPFWLGEAPARSDELSMAVSRLRGDIDVRLQGGDDPGIVDLAGRRGGHRSRRRRADGGLSRSHTRDARRRADAGHAGPRALLRRIGRHAAGAALAVRQPHQQGMGPRAAQAVLPSVQLRAPGGGDRGCAAPVARAPALVSARGRLPLPAPGDRRRRARAGAARRADVRDAVALEHDHRARGPAVPRRAQGAASAPAHARRRSARGRVSRRGGVPRKHPGRSPAARPSAGHPDGARLPRRRDGCGRSLAHPDSYSCRRASPGHA